VSLALLCSGQGGQHPRMFALTGDEPAAAALFAHAQTLLGQDARAWVQTAETADLQQNRNAQLLCTLQALSAYAVLAPHLPAKRCVAGYSVGEVAAWSIAGLIKPQDTLDLITARAEAMDAACQGEQGMLFVRGLNQSNVEAITASTEADIAIINPGDAFVIAGLRSALDTIAADAKKRGATRVLPVGVKIASHTCLMVDASVAFRDRISHTPIENALPAGTRLLSGIDGQPVLAVADGIEKLVNQISHPIHWAACLDACVEAGTTVFLELGPGRALTDMVTGTYPGIAARSLDEFKTIQGVSTWLAKAL
jgi:[acyl-carrier-protein] S-malonyltransferase